MFMYEGIVFLGEFVVLLLEVSAFIHVSAAVLAGHC